MLCNVKSGSFTHARVNEDAFGFDTDCAWVLDGSTGLNGKRLVAGPDGSDAQWYATAFSDYLKTALPHSEVPLPEVFSSGVQTVWERILAPGRGMCAKRRCPLLCRHSDPYP